MATIDEKTKVPLLWSLSAGVAIVSGAIWLGSIDARATIASAEVRGARELLMDIVQRLARIEQKQNDLLKESK